MKSLTSFFRLQMEKQPAHEEFQFLQSPPYGHFKKTAFTQFRIGRIKPFGNFEVATMTVHKFNLYSGGVFRCNCQS